METGRTGVTGPLVTSHVEQVFRRVDEIALIQNQHLAAKYVLVIKRKLETVNLGTVKLTEVGLLGLGPHAPPLVARAGKQEGAPVPTPYHYTAEAPVLETLIMLNPAF